MNLTTCKKICKECPFRKDSANGWLGNHSIEDITHAMQYEQLFSCHMERDEDANLNKVLIEEGSQHICRGFLVSATKSCKLFGQNPDTGSELRRLQKELNITEEERESVLNKWEFIQHHDI